MTLVEPTSFALPARYFPLNRGAYEVTAGLKSLGTDFGNGPMDGRVFQIDADWPRYRSNKLDCRAERFGKYVARSDLDEPTAIAVVEWFAGRLTAEYPQWFARDGDRLTSRLTDETISLDGDPFAVFDALAMQVQEDVCVMRVDGGRDWLAAGHVCCPGHWALADKVGRPFTAIHEPVPGIEPINRSAKAFVRLMVDRGPFVRFAWGTGTDDRLNHHPEPPLGVPADVWRGRRFVPGDSTLFMRVERQITWGLPAVNAAVFTIRVSHWNGNEIRSDPERRRLLRDALLSMSPAALAYKGLAGSVEAVAAWLDGDA
jgi:hypothetical protein